MREVEHLHALPDGVADEVAVAMIGTGRTAMAILDTARIEAGDVVLVTAAAGGLGALLVAGGRWLAKRNQGGQTPRRGQTPLAWVWLAAPAGWEGLD